MLPFHLHALKIVGDGLRLWLVKLIVSGSSGPGSNLGWGYRIPFLDKSKYFDCDYLHPGVEKSTKNLMLG